jgi:hypothetical protein
MNALSRPGEPTTGSSKTGAPAASTGITRPGSGLIAGELRDNQGDAAEHLQRLNEVLSRVLAALASLQPLEQAVQDFELEGALALLQELKPVLLQAR